MSLIMTLHVKGDPAKLEEVAGSDPARMRAIADKAEEHGVIGHRFYGSEDGRIMVVDEWPDPQSFQVFFDGSRSEIEALMEDVGTTGEPEVTMWRKLDSRDEIGWSD